MRVDVNGTQIDLAPNSRPYLLKRIAADGFDTVLIFALFMLFTALLLKTPAADTYHAHFDRYQAIEAETAAALDNDAEAISKALSGKHSTMRLDGQVTERDVATPEELEELLRDEFGIVMYIPRGKPL